MPYRLCPDCKEIVPYADWRSHRQRHQARRGSTSPWRRLRAQIIARDGHRCTRCLRTDGLEVHHIDGDWRNDDPSNLITLCTDCHPRGRPPS